MTAAALDFSVSTELRDSIRSWRTRALILGIIGVILLVLGWITSPAQFYRSYLWAYVYVLGIAAGFQAAEEKAMRIQIARVEGNGTPEIRSGRSGPLFPEGEPAPLYQDVGPRRLVGQESVQNLPCFREARQVLPATPQPEDHGGVFRPVFVQPGVFADGLFGLTDALVTQSTSLVGSSPTSVAIALRKTCGLVSSA